MPSLLKNIGGAFYFISLAGTYVAVAVIVSYFTSHFCFGGELRG